jgi:hypothetical protein
MHPVVLSGIRPSFPGLSQSAGQITHVLLTRSPLEHPRKGLSVRLACVKHAASVRPEPGSNSPNKNHSEKPDKHHKRDKKTTPNHGDGQMRQKTNNKQKPPNTLLSSQTTHPPTAQQAHGSGPCASSADGQGVHRSGPPSGMPSRSADWPPRDGFTKLREGPVGVKQRAGGALFVSTGLQNTLHPGNIPLAAAQHQPPLVQEVRWRGRPVVGVDPGVVDRDAALGDGAPSRALAGR